MKSIFLAAGLVMALALPAFGGTNYNVCFSTLDADGDGTMSKAEFMVAFSDGDTAVFDAVDSDSNGAVTHEEWEGFKHEQGFDDIHNS